LLVLLAAIAIVVMVLPAIIAFRRNHAYKWIILVLSLFAWTGVVWVAAFIWAVWPQEKSLIDPVLGSVTGLGKRNAGDTIGAAGYGVQRGYEAERLADAKDGAARHNTTRLHER
jgi:hypothetical protein